MAHLALFNALAKFPYAQKIIYKAQSSREGNKELKLFPFVYVKTIRGDGNGKETICNRGAYFST